MIAHNRPPAHSSSRLLKRDNHHASLSSPRGRAGMATANTASQDPPPCPLPPRLSMQAHVKQTHDTFLSHDTRDRATPPWRIREHSSSPELLFGTLCLWTPRCGAPPRRSHLHASPSPLPKAKPKQNPSGSAAVHAAHHLPDVLVGLADDRQHRRLVLLVGHRHVGRREEVGDLRRRLGRHL